MYNKCDMDKLPKRAWPEEREEQGWDGKTAWH